MPVSLFTDPSHYRPELRTYLHPLLKPFIGKSSGFTDRQRKEMYGLGEEDFKLATGPTKAQIAILPMAWNYYRYHDRLERAFSFWEQSRKAGLTVFSWNAGDFGVRVPKLEGLVVHRCGGYRSKLPPYHRGMPVFIADPLKRWYDRSEIFLRKKGEKPVVGFCGQAKGHAMKYAIDFVRTAWRNGKYYAGLTHDEPQSVYPSTLLRKRVLDSVESDDRVHANFIRRKQYRAGVRTEKERQRTTLEFYDNMLHSDYIVCVRGGGNFSVRLYETLAMGRIPLFIDTDCLLPLEKEKLWTQQMVWIEQGKISDIPQQLVHFHSSLSLIAFRKLQQVNRLIWKNCLSLKGFFLREINTWE